jgi:hypothetical protein
MGSAVSDAGEPRVARVPLPFFGVATIQPKFFQTGHQLAISVFGGTQCLLQFRYPLLEHPAFVPQRAGFAVRGMQ